MLSLTSGALSLSSAALSRIAAATTPTPTDAPDAAVVVADFWSGLGDFFASPLGKLVYTAIVIVLAWVLAWALRHAIRRVVAQIVNGVKKNQGAEDTQALNVSPLSAVRLVQRTRTIGTVLANIVNVVVAVIAVVLIVNRIDNSLIGSLSLLTAALGAGLGFGAQNIVKDVFNGLFMVMEDQLGVGDVVDVGAATGVVERVGVRITQVRDVNGTLWFVRNGEILRVGNMSQGWARVIVDLAVPYDSDVQAVEDQALETATALSKEPKWRSRIMERPQLWGLESISDDNLVIRLVMKTRTTARDDVSRELHARLKTDFDAMGVQLPSLKSVVLSGFDAASSVMGAHPPRTRSVSTVSKSLTKQPPARRTMPKAGTPVAGAPKNATHVDPTEHPLSTAVISTGEIAAAKRTKAVADAAAAAVDRAMDGDGENAAVPTKPTPLTKPAAPDEPRKKNPNTPKDGA